MASTGGGKSVETVVFDIGNVLIDWNPRYLYRKVFADEEEMEHFLGTVATFEWHLEQDRGRSQEEATALLFSQYPEYAREIEAYYGRWEEMFGGPIEGSVRLLEELCERSYPLYALTNWSAETFPLARDLYRFLGLFDEIVVSGELGMIKPDPEIYGVLVERTGLDPTASVFIDDSAPNVRAAEALGFMGVLFEGAEGLRDDLSTLGLLHDGDDSPRRAVEDGN